MVPMVAMPFGWVCRNGMKRIDWFLPPPSKYAAAPLTRCFWTPPFAALDAQTRQLMQEELLRIWEAERKTVVYVTHSLEEAVMLGDRVALMTARPRRIKQIYPVDLPRPRTHALRTTVAFNQVVQMIWDDLVNEVNMAREQEWGVVSERVAPEEETETKWDEQNRVTAKPNASIG